MRVVRAELADANTFVAEYHRHHKPVRGHRFSLGAEIDGRLIGVVIVGRPVARLTDQKYIAEVTRLCTDGTEHACSFLYGAAARAAKTLGFRSIQTFILESESGVSLKASGWQPCGTTTGGDWERVSKPNRRQDQPQCPKAKWVRYL